MRLKNKRRFFGACLLLLLGINLIAFRPRAEDPASFQIVTVQAGDTLWEIAQEYAPADCDIRSFVWELKKLNRLETGEVFENQVLSIPLS